MLILIFDRSILFTRSLPIVLTRNSYDNRWNLVRSRENHCPRRLIAAAAAVITLSMFHRTIVRNPGRYSTFVLPSLLVKELCRTTCPFSRLTLFTFYAFFNENNDHCPRINRHPVPPVRVFAFTVTTCQPTSSWPNGKTPSRFYSHVHAYRSVGNSLSPFEVVKPKVI